MCKCAKIAVDLSDDEQSKESKIEIMKLSKSRLKAIKHGLNEDKSYKGLGRHAKVEKKTALAVLGAPPEVDTDTDKKEESVNTAPTHGSEVLTSGNILLDPTTKYVNIDFSQWRVIMSFVWSDLYIVTYFSNC